MKGFVSIPKDWLGPEGSFLLGNLNINVNQIVMYFLGVTGKYIRLTDGTEWRINAPFAELEKKIKEAIE